MFHPKQQIGGAYNIIPINGVQSNPTLDDIPTNNVLYNDRVAYIDAYNTQTNYVST